MDDEVNYIYVCFSHAPDDWISRVMAWFTFGKWTHVALMHRSGDVIEASSFGAPRGVRMTSFYKFREAHPHMVVRKIFHPSPDLVWEKAKEKLGAPYDYWWLLGWLLRKKTMQKPYAYTCSELIATCCREAGHSLFVDDHEWYVSAHMLYLISEEV